MGGGDHTVLFGDQIFNVHFPADGLNFGAARIVVFLPDLAQFLLDDLHHQLMVRQNSFQFPNALHQRFVVKMRKRSVTTLLLHAEI